ncbi:hypothetical protein [Ligilactobacillus agilis]|uniref:hypothetical protein n=1 Tax=Ligilactobacillus agilis TaxID=1601 RepID=UPI00067E780D|nr:hypothetical protein [Ligilactobacillus agilis]
MAASYRNRLPILIRNRGGYFQPANISTIMQSGSTSNQGTIGSLQRMIQNIAIANGTAIGSTLINLTAPNLPPGIQVTWYLALFVVAIIVIAEISINYLRPEKA